MVKIVLHKSSLQAQLLYKHLFAKFSLSKSQPNFQSLFFKIWSEVKFVSQLREPTLRPAEEKIIN